MWCDSLRLPCPTRGRRPLNCIDCLARDIGHKIADVCKHLCRTEIHVLGMALCTLSRMRPPSSSSSYISTCPIPRGKWKSNLGKYFGTAQKQFFFLTEFYKVHLEYISTSVLLDKNYSFVSFGQEKSLMGKCFQLIDNPYSGKCWKNGYHPVLQNNKSINLNWSTFYFSYYTLSVTWFCDVRVQEEVLKWYAIIFILFKLIGTDTMEICQTVISCLTIYLSFRMIFHLRLCRFAPLKLSPLISQCAMRHYHPEQISFLPPHIGTVTAN